MVNKKALHTGGFSFFLERAGLLFLDFKREQYVGWF